MILYTLGVYCLIFKRNIIRLLLALELILNAANLNIIVFSSYAKEGYIDPLGQSFTIISISIGGCIMALGLALILQIYRRYGTLDVRELRRLKH